MKKRRTFRRAPAAQSKARTKQMRSLAKQTFAHTDDRARFSRARPVIRLSDISHFPKQTMTLRIYGLRAMGWDGSQPPGAIVNPLTIVQNFKDYVPRWMKIHSLTLITPRGLTGGPIGSDPGSTDPAYGVMTTLVFITGWGFQQE